jgi:hypothetical protein
MGSRRPIIYGSGYRMPIYYGSTGTGSTKLKVPVGDTTKER